MNMNNQYLLDESYEVLKEERKLLLDKNKYQKKYRK